MLLFGSRNPEVAYPSEHRRIEPLDGEAIEAPVDDKQRAVEHYTALAEEARLESYAEADVEAILADAALDGFELWMNGKVGDA